MSRRVVDVAEIIYDELQKFVLSKATMREIATTVPWPRSWNVQGQRCSNT